MAKDQELSNEQTFAARLARWGEKRDFHSKKVFSDYDFAGEISAKAFKNVSETSNDDNPGDSIRCRIRSDPIEFYHPTKSRWIPGWEINVGSERKIFMKFQ